MAFELEFVVISKCPGLFPTMRIRKSLCPSGSISTKDGDISTSSGCCFVNAIVNVSFTVPLLGEIKVTLKMEIK